MSSFVNYGEYSLDTTFTALNRGVYWQQNFQSEKGVPNRIWVMLILREGGRGGGGGRGDYSPLSWLWSLSWLVTRTWGAQYRSSASALKLSQDGSPSYVLLLSPPSERKDNSRFNLLLIEHQH